MLKATGKAIEKLLRIAVWTQGQDDLRVRYQTCGVGAVDDIVEARSEKSDAEASVDEEKEVEGSRIRRTSCLEVYVGLR